MGRKAAADLAERPVATRLEAATEGMVEAGWLAALMVVPLFFNVYSSQSFEPDTIAVLEVIAIVMAAAWVVKIAGGGRLFRPRAAGAGGAGVPLLVPVAAVVVTTAIGTVLSVDVRASVWGSYARGQGALASAAFLVVFVLAAAHLRTASQWRRAAGVIVATSFAVSLYALIQQLGIDPVPWSGETRRVGSSLGNPIFLGAYLVTVGFVTLHELGHRLGRLTVPRDRPEAGPPRRGVLTLQAGVLLYVLAFQLLALVLSQSRGPLLGVLAGGYVYFLVTLLIARRRSAEIRAMSPWLRAILRWGWLAVVSAGLGGIAFLVAFNLPGSPMAPLRDTPYLGRLGTVFDLSSRTAQVRVQTWRGCVDLLGSDTPVRPPHGDPDPLDAWRPLVGYGPETLGLVFGPHQPAALERLERRRAVPDRAHNLTFELLVTSGVAGWLAWLSLYCGVFYHSLRWLGLCGTRRRRIGFWTSLVAGAVAGAGLPVLIEGSAVLAGVGVAAGMVVGLLAYVTVAALASGGGSSRFGAREGLVLAVLATVVGHFVEVHFGIAVAASQLLFWFLTAVLVAVGAGWMGVATAEAGGASRRKPVKRDSPASASPRLDGVVAGLMWATACVVIVFDMMGNWNQAAGPWPIVRSLVASGGGITGTAWLLLFATLVAAAMLIDPGVAARRRERRRFVAGFVPTVVAIPAAFAFLHAVRLAATGRMRAAGADVVELSDHVANHVWVVAVVVVVLVVVTGGAIALSEPGSWRGRGFSRARTAVAAVAAALAAAWLGGAAMRPVRADVLLKHGRSFTDAGNAAVAARLISRAVELDPHEPMHRLYAGTAAISGARASDAADDRRRWIEQAGRVLRSARDAAPLDPDHTANLARLAVIRSQMATDPDRRGELLEQADREFEEALRLRPGSSVLVRESAAALVALGEPGRAIRRLEQAVEDHSLDAGLVLELVSAYQREATAAEAEGDDGSARRRRVAAADVLARAAAMWPKNERIARTLAAMSARLDRRDDAIEAYRGLVEQFGGDFDTHRVLAVLYFEQGDAERALRHAERARELASPDRDAEVAALLRLVSGNGDRPGGDSG